MMNYSILKTLNQDYLFRNYHNPTNIFGFNIEIVKLIWLCYRKDQLFVMYVLDSFIFLS